ncbi:MAG: protein kinase [Polyangiaceae bacterium]
MCNARVGRLLKGKWKLERVLGIGGMAAVYEGVHHIGRKDAIKILHPEVARQPDLKRRFEVEASATNRFAHRGAVEIRDFDVSEDGCPFLVMEMLDGESLGERARRTGEIAERDLLRYVDQLLDVLAAAHREGIVHRDIKLDNVFITRDDEVKVLDFGVARILSGPVLTMAGTRLGTPAYMPPEQLRGLEVDGRADLFAVGATMFRLLTKRRIHEAPTEGQLILKMSTEPAPKTRTVEPSVSENVALVIDRALAFLASARYQNAITMQEDVREVLAGNPPPFASARSRAESLGATAPDASADRPTVAPSSVAVGAGFGIDPTGATVHHGPNAAARAIATTAPMNDAFASSATTAAANAAAPPSVRLVTGGGPADPSAATQYGAPAPPIGRAAIASTVAADPAAFSLVAPTPSAPVVSPGRRAIAATAAMPPEPSSVEVRRAPARRSSHSLAPILLVFGITALVGIVGLVLFLRASASDASSTASAALPAESSPSVESSAPTQVDSAIRPTPSPIASPSASPAESASAPPRPTIDPVKLLPLLNPEPVPPPPPITAQPTHGPPPPKKPKPKPRDFEHER